jgi:4-hydroxyacetophenone monooxygenase
VSLIETQVRYVTELMLQMMTLHPEGFAVEVKKDVHDAFNLRVQQAHDRMIWTHKGMTNWYRNPQGRVVATTPFRNDDYWHMTRGTKLADYVVLGKGRSDAVAREARLDGLEEARQ